MLGVSNVDTKYFMCRHTSVCTLFSLLVTARFRGLNANGPSEMMSVCVS